LADEDQGDRGWNHQDHSAGYQAQQKVVEGGSHGFKPFYNVRISMLTILAVVVMVEKWDPRWSRCAQARAIAAGADRIGLEWVSPIVTKSLLPMADAPTPDFNAILAALLMSNGLSIGLGLVLGTMTFLFIVRIVLTWYPQVEATKFPFSLAVLPTELFLGPTRRLIPPIGGVDISPIIWVGVVSLIREILLGQQGLLTMLHS
jgi:YggT family protein